MKLAPAFCLTETNVAPQFFQASYCQTLGLNPETVSPVALISNFPFLSLLNILTQRHAANEANLRELINRKQEIYCNFGDVVYVNSRDGFIINYGIRVVPKIRRNILRSNTFVYLLRCNIKLNVQIFIPCLVTGFCTTLIQNTACDFVN